MANEINEVDTPEEVEVEKEKLAGSRKLVVTGVVLVVGVAISVVKGDIPAGLLQLLEVVFGGFIVGNVAGHALGVGADTMAMKYAPPEAPKDVPTITEHYNNADRDAVVDNIQKEVIQQSEALNIIQQTLLMIIKKSGLDK